MDLKENDKNLIRDISQESALEVVEAGDKKLNAEI